jgi:hypothetical protein
MNNKEYYDELAIETCQLFLSKEIDLEELGSRIKDFVGDYKLTEDLRRNENLCSILSLVGYVCCVL